MARADRGGLDVLTADGPVRAVAALPVTRAAAADPAQAPIAGDWVAVRTADGPGERALLVGVLPRRTAVVRRSGRNPASGQVLAANVDVLLLVTAALPAAPLNRVERFLALAWDSGARPVVVLTKTDLVGDGPEQLRRLALAAPGAEVLAASGVTGAGVEAVADLLGPGVTGALIGASGAGKSTLANALAGAQVQATAPLRADGKGRHTTAWRELVVLPSGGVLLDTPGLRGLQLREASEGIARTFADVTDLAVDCRFRDCRHEGEPGCAVRAAVDAGLLDQRRVDSHARLQREQTWLATRTDALARLEERRRWKLIDRQARRDRPRGDGPRG